LKSGSLGYWFLPPGLTRQVAAAIEQYAHGQGHVNAIVRPTWETARNMLIMR